MKSSLDPSNIKYDKTDKRKTNPKVIKIGLQVLKYSIIKFIFLALFSNSETLQDPTDLRSLFISSKL